jgi:hypothetical protein
MPTLQQILEQFAEQFEDFYCTDSEEYANDSEEQYYKHLQSFITSTYKSIIEGEIDHLQREIDRHTSYMTQMQSKKSYDEGNVAEEILQDQIDYLQNKLNEIE